MPLKICPECEAEHGPRKLQCDCGYVFSAKKNKNDKKAVNDYIPGGYFRWHEEMPTGKKIEPPDPLPKRGKIDIDVVRDYVSYHGLGDAIEFIPAKKIEDTELRKLWQTALKNLKKVHEKIYN